MFLILLQGSLFFTEFHRNRFWTTFLEVFVLIHAISVSFFTYESIAESEHAGWHFIFGWFLIFVVTQMYGLGLSKLQRTILWLSFFISVPLVYTLDDKWAEASRLLLIPLGSYAAVFFFAVLIWLFFLLPKKLLK